MHSSIMSYLLHDRVQASQRVAPRRPQTDYGTAAPPLLNMLLKLLLLLEPSPVLGLRFRLFLRRLSPLTLKQFFSRR